jgi:hypothetical protein
LLGIVLDLDLIVGAPQRAGFFFDVWSHCCLPVSLCLVGHCLPNQSVNQRYLIWIGNQFLPYISQWLGIIS